jgi:hypothetical protein
MTENIRSLSYSKGGIDKLCLSMEIKTARDRAGDK